MRSVVLTEAEEGDVVAEPVVNDRGMVILPKGANLTSKVIDRLRNMNVTELVVEGEDPDAPPPKMREEQLEELEARFEGHENSPAMIAIREKAREHLQSRFEDEE